MCHFWGHRESSSRLEYGHQQRVADSGEALHESINLHNLITTALSGFEALQTGTVAIGGATGALVHRALLAMRDLP